MKTIDHYFKKKIPTLRGQVIAIGCKELFLNEIDKNDGITTCYVLNNMDRSNGTGAGKRNRRSVNIKKFKRKFKKNRTNVMIVDALEVLDFRKRFVSSSVYITKENIYIYTEKTSENLDQMIEKYYRYDVDIKEISCTDGKIYTIHCERAKTSRFKDFGYLVKDTWNEAIDILGDYLIH